MLHSVMVGLLWLYGAAITLLLASILFTIVGMLIWKD